MLLREWTSEITVSPVEALASRQWFQPIVGNLEALRDAGKTFVTEQNQHGDGFYCWLRIEGATLRIEYHRAGPEAKDYGAEHLASALERILAGKDIGNPVFNSNVH